MLSRRWHLRRRANFFGHVEAWGRRQKAAGPHSFKRESLLRGFLVPMQQG